MTPSEDIPPLGFPDEPGKHAPMTDEAKRRLVKEALGWSAEIGCCPDKERYALRVWDLLDRLGIQPGDVPGNVVAALKDLMSWEECAGPCATVDAFLRGLRY